MIEAFLAPLVIITAVSNPVIMNYDPPSATRWEQSVTFRCGDTTVRIRGYGASKPVDRVANVAVNGRPLSGEKVDALRRDLSSRRAVYRLTARCPRDKSSLALFIDVGEKTADGQVIYRSGSALISNGRLASYTALQTADADQFWFR